MLKKIALLLGCMSLVGCSHKEPQVYYEGSPIQQDKPGARFEDGKFHNSEIDWSMKLSSIWEASKQEKAEDSVPDDPLPIRDIPASELKSNGKDRLYRLGHSTVLMSLSDQWVLTDPMFSERASPVTWAGPERFDRTPIRIEQLPKLKAVVVSHNHYDHLDKQSIKQLNDKTEFFIVPLRVGRSLLKWGVPADKIIELDWWQGVKLDGLTLTATPAQHFSNRGLFDQMETLWASYVIETPATRIFFSGDTGYFGGFAEIGKRFGRFDLALLEVGAYNKLWRDIHMLPEDAMQAGIDLNATAIVPIHNGTFDLAYHSWWEPLEAMEKLSAANDKRVLLPRIGEQVSIHSPEIPAAWWKQYLPQSKTLTTEYTDRE